MRVGILGFGREGRSLLKFLRKSAQYKDAEFWIVDKKTTIKIPQGVQARLGKNYLKNLADFDIVFRSPGIPYNLPELKKARRAGVGFSSATKLFFDNCPAKIIGITGTKGKSTTSTLLYQILQAALRRGSGPTKKTNVFLVGNIGKPALEILPRINKNSLVILELSSFQLQDLERSPQLAVVLDIFPDHQDAHANLREYYEAKTNIARYQRPGDRIFFFSAKGGSSPTGLAGASGGKHNTLSRWVAFSGRGKKIAVDEKNFKLFEPLDLKINGGHNFKNAAMAATVAKSLGVSPKTILKVIKNFRGLEHRLEFVHKIMVRQAHHKNKSAIYFYNDSASTNPQTTAAALRAFSDEAKILIAGGQDKGLNYAPLARALKNSRKERDSPTAANTKLVVLFGENKYKIRRQIAKSKMQVVIVQDLAAAVKIAHAFAKQFVISHGSSVIVLLSPGAASFDQFHDYVGRGRQFKKLIREIK